MPTDHASLKISIDSRDVKNADKSLDDLSKTSTKTEETTKRLSTAMKVGLVASSYAAYTVINKLKQAGFEFNKSMEQSINGLTALTVATSSNVSSTGKLLSIQEKYSLAQKEAVKTAKELLEINVATPHTLDQTNQIYKAMFVSMKKAGATTSEMVDLTKKISIASGAAGIEFNSLLAGVDGLASGTVMASSDLGRFLNSLGLSNEKLKASANIYETVNAALKDFRAVDDYATAVSNLDNAYTRLAGVMTEDLFNGAKEGANALSKAISSLSEEDTEALKQSMNAIGTVTATVLYGMAVGTVEVANAFESLGARIAGIAFRLESGVFLSDEESKALEKMYQQTKENMEAREKVLEALATARDAFTSDLTKKINTPTPKDSGVLAAKEYEDEELIKAEAKRIEKLEKLNTDYQQSILDINQSMAEQRLEGLDREALQTFNYYDNLMIKYAEVAGAEETLRQLQIDGMNEIYAKAEENLLAEALESMLTPLDIAIDKFEELEGAMLKAYGAGSKEMQKFYLIQGKNLSKVAKAQDDNSDDAIKQNKNQINSFEDLYGTSTSLMNEFYDADDDRKKKQMEVDRAIRIITNTARLADLATALTTETTKQSSLATTALVAQLQIPFPGNIPAYAAVAGMIASLGIALGGSGGGSGGGASAPSAKEVATTKVEDTYTPITDRLDRQIELMESLDLKGSTGVTQVALSQAEFAKASELLRVEIMSQLNTTQVGGIEAFIQKYSQVAVEQNRSLNLAISDPLSSLGDLRKSFVLTVEQAKAELAKSAFDIVASLSGDFTGQRLVEYNNLIGLAQEAINDYAISMVDTVAEMKDAGKTFEDLFDSITQTSKYAELELKKAQADVAKLTRGNSLESYLEKQISAINQVSESFGMNIQKLLLSTNKADLQRQAEAVDALAIASNRAFVGGVEEALNFLDSIELVGEALATSRDNIKEYLDSFKTNQELAEDMAAEDRIKYVRGADGTWKTFLAHAVTLATTMEELDRLFINLSSDADGLTDSELELLEANKALIETRVEEAEALAKARLDERVGLQNTYDLLTGVTTQRELDIKNIDSTNQALQKSIWLEQDRQQSIKDYIGELTSSLSKLDPITSKLRTTIESLRESSTTSEQSLAKFYEAMNEATTLSTSGSYEDFVTAVQKATSLSSVLNNAENFSLSRDMDFAKLVAANQFESLESITLKEIDYLKMIVDNTAPLKEASTTYGFGGATSVPSIAQSVVNPNLAGSYIQNDNVNVVSALTNQNVLLNAIITKQDTQITILRESRDIQNGSLVVLENIEAVS